MRPSVSPALWKKWVGVIWGIDVYKEEQKFPANDEMALIRCSPAPSMNTLQSMVSKRTE